MQDRKYKVAEELLKEGHHLTDVAKKIGVSYTELNNYCRLNNIDFVRQKTRIPFEFHEQIKERYLTGESCTKIGKSLGFGHVAIARFLKNVANISIRPHTEDKYYNKNYTINKDAFLDTGTEPCAYFFGWILSDGYLCPKNKYVTIALQESDIEILENLRDYLSSNNVIIPRVHENGKKSNQFTFSGKEIVSRLMNLGLRNAKSLNEKCPEVFKKNNHFWRGYIEGDGSIYRGKSQVRVEVHGGQKICEDFSEYCSGFGVKTTITHVVTHTGTKVYRATVNGFSNSKIILDEIYRDSSLRLSRKYQTYLDRIVNGLY